MLTARTSDTFRKGREGNTNLHRSSTGGWAVSNKGQWRGVSPVRVIVQYAGVHGVDQALHFAVLALKSTISSNLGVSPGHVGEVKNVSNLHTYVN